MSLIKKKKEESIINDILLKNRKINKKGNYNEKELELEMKEGWILTIIINISIIE